jgi:tetratricopeptide (TPR) repeat protein
MSRLSTRAVAPGRLLVLLATTLVMLSAGCDQLSARRQIQEGDALYKSGRYSEAVEQYESALETVPDLAIGHHNAGITYLKLFKPGVEKKENLAYADKATAHFEAYLEQFPDDTKIVSLLTKTWIDSGRYEKALAYWKAELKKDPENRDVLVMLANINRQAGEPDKAIEWHRRRVEVETETEGKINAYVDIATLELSRLRKSDVVGMERVQIADTAIAALQQVLELEPDHIMAQSYLGSIYQLRALAHGASWARTLDLASSRHHLRKWLKLNKAAQAKQAAQAKPKQKGTGDEPKKDESGG